MSAYETFFMWFGVICAVVILLSVFNFSAGWYLRARHESYYIGLRNQIMFVDDEIEKYFNQQQMLPIGEVRKILLTLHDRRYPNISQLAHDERYKRIEYAEERHNQEVLTNYPIGTKVIVRSNEPGPLLIGEVVEHVFHENSGRYDALGIKRESDGELRYTFNTRPIYYSDETLAALNKLTWWEQWNVIAGGLHSYTEEDAALKEKMDAEIPHDERLT